MFTLFQFLLFGLTAVTASAVLAGPEIINLPYSGRLVDDTSKPIDGPVDVVIEFFSTEEEGSSLSGPHHFSKVTLTDGVFQLNLGLPSETFHLIFPNVHTATWLQIIDATNGVSYPRQLLAAAPYALKVPVDGSTITYDERGQLQVIPGGIVDQALFERASGVALKSHSSASATGELRFHELPTNGDRYLGFKAPVDITAGSNTVWTLPPTDGGGGQLLATDGNGNLSWVTDRDTVASLGSSVDSSEVENGTLQDADISSSASIATSKLQGPVTAIANHGLGSLATKSSIGPVEIDATSVTPGSYTLPAITVDSDGRLTSAVSGSVDLSSNVTGSLPVANGGTGATTEAGARNNLIAAKSGANTDITSLGSLMDNTISGDKVDGGTISNFTSTGIDDNSAATAMTIDTSGNVGLGTTVPQSSLDVAGEVRIGSTGVTCTASNAGGLRYVSGSLEVCDGTQWAQVGGSQNSNPAGEVRSFATATCPAGWLNANGQVVSRTTFTELFSAVGETYGSGDGSTTYKVPDYRGYFLRGWDQGRGADPDSATRGDRGDGTLGDNIGTIQTGQIQSHAHSYTRGYLSVHGHRGGGNGIVVAQGTASTSGAGGLETRPININVLYCISTGQ